jgi:hypothetical protein
VNIGMETVIETSRQAQDIIAELVQVYAKRYLF